MHRRDFLHAFLAPLSSYALVRTLIVHDAFGSAVRPLTDRWVQDLHAMSQDLKTGAITPGQWQDRIQTLFDRVPLEDLVARIDFDRLVQGFEYPDLGVHTRNVRFPHLEGLPESLAFFSKVFGMRKDRAIIPHGHRNMASCHYVLRGELRLRHYDKLEEDDNHLIITPTIDTTARPGSHSSISDERNNIHWLKAETDTAFTFDVIVLDLGGDKWEVDNIDPYNAERLGDERLRVRKLDVETALQQYGHDTHH